MQGYCSITRIVYMSLSYLSIICGSMGMMFFATKFPFSTNIKQLKFAPERFLGLDGYQVWWLSWLLIIVGTFIQLLDFWFHS